MDNLLILLKYAVLLKNYSMGKMPHEACAFLFGRDEKKSAKVESIQPVINISNEYHSFKVRTSDSEKSKRADDYLGFYHSHLFSPLPSIYDMETMKERMNEVWLIGGLNNTPYTKNENRFELQAFLCENGTISKLKVSYE